MDFYLLFLIACNFVFSILLNVFISTKIEKVKNECKLDVLGGFISSGIRLNLIFLSQLAISFSYYFFDFNIYFLKIFTVFNSFFLIYTIINLLDISLKK